MDQLFHLFAYLKKYNRSALVFDWTEPELDESRFQEVDWKEFYPEAAEATAPLTGAAGTECLFLIGRRSDEAISLEQIKAAWGTTAEWPSLPPFTVLRLAGTDVIREQIGRDLGPPRSTGLTPADQITRTLKRFAGQLEPQFSLLEGLAFSHIEPAE